MYLLLRFFFLSEHTQRLARYFSCCPFHISLSEGCALRSCSDALWEMRFGSLGSTAGVRRSPAALSGALGRPTLRAESR